MPRCSPFFPLLPGGQRYHLLSDLLPAVNAVLGDEAVAEGLVLVAAVVVAVSAQGDDGQGAGGGYGLIQGLGGGSEGGDAVQAVVQLPGKVLKPCGV